tara:strand:+ start:356 stop:958 length:603 start_codon:yes stop_codon:yes gene_type:complete
MEKEILRLFLYNEKMKFSEIEKALKARSNKISYHLKNLINKKILEKGDRYYSLSETAENLIPYLSEKKHALAIILIHIGDGKNCFLHERKKRPFKGLLGLPGGKILIGETISKAIERVMREKHGIKAKLKKINSTTIEHIKNKKGIIQSDLIIFVTATTKNALAIKNIEESKGKIISSDYKLLKNHLKKETKIQVFLTPS